MNKQIQSDSDELFTIEPLIAELNAVADYLSSTRKTARGVAIGHSVSRLRNVIKLLPNTARPEFDSQDAPLTDEQILDMTYDFQPGGRQNAYADIWENEHFLAFARALLAQVKQPKTDSVHLDNSLAGDAVAPQSNGGGGKS